MKGATGGVKTKATHSSENQLSPPSFCQRNGFVCFIYHHCVCSSALTSLVPGGDREDEDDEEEDGSCLVVRVLMVVQ